MPNYGAIKYNERIRHIETGMQWLCGGCGGIHEWDCPYTAGPGYNWTEAQIADGKARMERDQAAGVGPFSPERRKKWEEGRTNKAATL